MGNIYNHGALGLQIEKPDSWKFFETDWNVSISDRFSLSEEERELLQKNASNPFLCMYKGDVNRVVPSVKLLCSPNDDELEAEDLQYVLQESFKKVFPDFRILSSSLGEKLDGYSGIYNHIGFKYETQAGKVERCLAKSWSFMVDQVVISISFSGPKLLFEKEKFNFDNIYKSISLQKPVLSTV